MGSRGTAVGSVLGLDEFGIRRVCHPSISSIAHRNSSGNVGRSRRWSWGPRRRGRGHRHGATSFCVCVIHLPARSRAVGEEVACSRAAEKAAVAEAERAPLAGAAPGPWARNSDGRRKRRHSQFRLEPNRRRGAGGELALGRRQEGSLGCAAPSRGAWRYRVHAEGPLPLEPDRQRGVVGTGKP